MIPAACSYSHLAQGWCMDRQVPVSVSAPPAAGRLTAAMAGSTALIRLLTNSLVFRDGKEHCCCRGADCFLGSDCGLAEARLPG